MQRDGEHRTEAGPAGEAEQEGIGADARLVFITHEAVERDVQATVRQLRELTVVRRVGGLIRVIGS